MLVLLIIGLYHKNDNVYQKLNPIIPSWCTRDPSQDPDDDLLYGELGGNEGSLLDDDDLFS